MGLVTLAATLACLGVLFFILVELNRSHQQRSRATVSFKITLYLEWIDQMTGAGRGKLFYVKATYIPRENEYIHVHFNREADRYSVPVGTYRVHGVHHQTERGELKVSVHANSTERLVE
jgi:hypothetical protein